MDDHPRVDRDAAPGLYGRLRVRADGLGPAQWLTGRTEAEGGFGRVAGISGPCFAAYARVVHPVTEDGEMAEGPTPPDVAQALIPVLARHTATADTCWFGLWQGYGRWDFDRFPTFLTPGREEVLLSGPLADVVSPVELDEFAELPDLWWPEDRAWCVGGDVDLVSTYVGGSPELISALLATPGIEAHAVGPRDRVR
ncbi:hypothetical protein [Streptomyces sp. NPDC101178]|uniref:hypothetical protein n=1 Tax=Streptomyces sp. NPDC101178 TaxID=3366124 RepID=UPI0038297736